MKQPLSTIAFTLFAPADRPERFAKALAAGADALAASTDPWLTLAQKAATVAREMATIFLRPGALAEVSGPGQSNTGAKIIDCERKLGFLRIRAPALRRRRARRRRPRDQGRSPRIVAAIAINSSSLAAVALAA